MSPLSDFRGLSGRFRWLFLSALLFVLTGLSGQGELKGASESFEKVADVLVRRCLECHSDHDSSGSLSLTKLGNIVKGGDSGPAFEPGLPIEENLILSRVRSGEMPPPLKGQPRPLPPEEIEILTAWISSGAAWPEGRVLDPYERTTDVRGGRDFWSLQPVRRPSIPGVKAPHWVANPVDAFILARLEAASFSPAPPAPRAVLIRRLYFDLIGLPPTAEEITDYVEDPRSDGVVKAELVERLLKSPHFGERWARQWLDLARYAETSGYERDQEKPGAWKYRDWVVNAANADMPYDRFILEQIAGDEIPDRTESSVIATGFLRLGTWNDEPNDPEEYKYDRLEDLVNVTCTSFIGLTVKCARCHDHKFDPILQSDYYKVAAAFWAGPIEARQRELLGGPSKEELGFDVLGWTDVTATPSDLWMLKKGDPKRPMAVVSPGTPAIVASLSAAAPTPRPTENSSQRRRQLAQWITDPAHPLTARVFVNRLWQSHFGKGLVRTSDNFGFTGDLPSHPELLDWLASEFQQEGWSPKHIHRLLVLSNTYGQSSLHPAAQQIESADAGNRLWWRFDRHRLDAEQIRDRMLTVSGAIDLRMGGPSFKPTVSAEALEGLSMKSNAWNASPPDEQRRRSLYMYSKRGLLPPLMTTFDFVETTLPCGQRDVSTVAPQALALMNNEFVHEQSRLLAKRIEGLAGPDDQARIQAAWQTTLGRLPSPTEIAAAQAHLTKQLERFSHLPKPKMTEPVDIPQRGVTLHLQASAGVERDASGRVIRWKDDSAGNHNATQPDPDRRPQWVADGMNGKPVIRFDGRRQFLHLEGQVVTSQQFTLVAVARDQGTEGHRTLFSNWNGGAGNSGTSLFFGTTSKSAVRLSDDFSGVGQLRSGKEPFLLIGQSNANEARIFENLTELASRSTPLAPRNLGTNYVLGQQGNIDGEYWQGDLAEIIVFDRSLSGEERIALTRELSKRYEIHLSAAPAEPSPHELALASLCHVLLNSNEFIYVD
ncbi:DUF1553 domain-containing protein [Schlesneria sp. DSM 10557]|uniref:DUF1553 domain-containing protein n=1 Tax=Schlesneria sp. DSM 10557 TaxID=3044399 RepID=UPI0035A0EDFF